jgi:soluble lytic murein transglycosylase-like protein
MPDRAGHRLQGLCKALYNPDTNLRYGMRYLRKALNRGSVGYYNAGIHAKRLPRAAKKYARQVASRY